MASRSNNLELDFQGKRFMLGAWVYMFQDHDYHVAFIPALNLSAYGKTSDQAYEMLLGEVLGDFFFHLFSLNSEEEANAELKKIGWVNARAKSFTAPYVDDDGVLQNFRLPKETKLTHKYATPNGEHK